MTVSRSVLEIGGDPELHALLTGALEPDLFEVQHAPSSTCALKLVEEQHYDLIVTNERESAKESIKLLRKVRRLRSFARVIILTGESTTMDVITAMQAHAFSYFSSPFSPHALQHMIRIAVQTTCEEEGIQIVLATEQRIRLNVRCDFETADRVLQFLHEMEHLPDSERTQLATVFRELLYNAIEYGGKLDPANHVEIDYARSPDKVTCRIKDHGPGFAFDKIPHAAIANPVDDPVRHIDVRQEQGMRPGGYGILIARQLVGQLIYEQNGKEVVVVKHFDSPKSQSSALAI